jgi:hypothetical protein
MREYARGKAVWHVWRAADGVSGVEDQVCVFFSFLPFSSTSSLLCSLPLCARFLQERNQYISFIPTASSPPPPCALRSFAPHVIYLIDPICVQALIALQILFPSTPIVTGHHESLPTYAECSFVFHALVLFYPARAISITYHLPRCVLRRVAL